MTSTTPRKYLVPHTFDIISLLRSWCSPGCINKTTMAHVRFDMIAVDNLVPPCLNRVKEPESAIVPLLRGIKPR